MNAELKADPEAELAIIVSFSVTPPARAAFMALLRENVRISVTREPGCRRFDIIEPPQRAEEVWLYEIYRDRPAFEEHLRAAHFLGFEAATRDMVVAKTVIAGRCEENVKA
jgi:quinol monooxygenase YgiN